MTRPLRDRVMERVGEPDENGCWPWTGSMNHLGYGDFSYRDRDSGRRTNTTAHRLVYQFTVGPIPDGMVIDHLCRNRWCVNPDHLEPVTQKVNVHRGNGLAQGPAIRELIRRHSAEYAQLLDEYRVSFPAPEQVA